MIRSARLYDGFVDKLPALAGRTFAFAPGLNVLFGPNASGKTTLLRGVAAYAGCGEGGWSAPARPMAYGFGCPRPSDALAMAPGLERDVAVAAQFARAARDAAPGKCGADVGWDGVPALLWRTGSLASSRFSDDQDEFNEQLASIFAKPSAGQATVGRIRALDQAVARGAAYDLTEPRQAWTMDGQALSYDHINDSWQAAIDLFCTYVRTALAPPPPGDPARRCTILLDEPDASLSIPNQRGLWTHALPGLAARAQVIVATHSPFALAAPGVTLHELKDGYAAACRAALRTAFGGDA